MDKGDRTQEKSHVRCYVGALEWSKNYNIRANSPEGAGRDYLRRVVRPVPFSIVSNNSGATSNYIYFLRGSGRRFDGSCFV